MPTDIITVKSLFPALRNTKVARPASDTFNTSFIGIDFGTSTTVVSIATIDKETKEITTRPIWLNQKLADGVKMSSEKIPTVIAWYNNQLLVGKGAADLKYKLKKDVNIWYSFKMELGEDLGVKYYNSELGRNSSTPILNPKDAAKVFFQYLKEEIERYIRQNNLPTNVQYAVSVPASFEANQRKDLIYALEKSGISINKQSLIDEPNAAFLSYVQVSSYEKNPLILPDGDNPIVLVFDFGAGTCDISILELGKDLNGIYSKNLSISKFEKLGGDDIDRLIAIDYLFPKMLEESGKKHEDFKTPEKNRIITQLLKPAEQLKIMICENIALKMSNRILPREAKSDEYVSLGTPIKIETKKGLLKLLEPKLSYAEFNQVMKIFLKSDALIPYKTKIINDEFVTIFSPIETALKKASLSKDDIDYVLLIGGSSKNPYVQAALKKYFEESELLIPRDLQTHVAAGAAIHSLIFNGFNKNIIQPITSEPLLLITRDETPKVIFRAGTQIPCEQNVIDDLVTAEDGQKAIELPICVGNINKMIFNLKIASSSLDGFKKNTCVKLFIEITTDKLLKVQAEVEDKSVETILEPFSNKELTTKERIVREAEKQANIEAERNGGKPTREALERLYRAYEKVGDYLRAAEALEDLKELFPNDYCYNVIGVLYSKAGYDDKALEYFELAYNKEKTATAAFNLALKIKNKDRERAKKLLKESLEMEPEMPHSLFELGRLLKKENNPEGLEMIKKAFNIWKREYETNHLSENDYGWLASAAEELGMRDFAQQVRDSRPKFEGDKLYNFENLTVTYKEERIIKR